MDRLANFAAGVQRLLGWFLLFAGLASAFIAWRAFDAGSLWWWNGVKCGLALIPVLLWLFIYNVLNQFKEAPEWVSDLAERDDFSLVEFSAADGSFSLLKAFTTVRELRDNDAVEMVTDTFGSIAILVNPAFMIVAFAAMVVLFILMMLAPILLLF